MHLVQHVVYPVLNLRKSLLQVKDQRKKQRKGRDTNRKICSYRVLFTFQLRGSGKKLKEKMCDVPK